MQNAFRKVLTLVGVVAIAGSVSHADIVFNVGDGEDEGVFGKAGGVVIQFGEFNQAPQNWTPARPTDGLTYSIDSISFIKNNGSTGVGGTYDELWIGVYDSIEGDGESEALIGNFLGASTTSVDFASFEEGQTVAWNFEGVVLEAGTNQQLVFLFQLSNEPSTKMVVNEGAISLVRVAGSGGGFGDQGAGTVFADEGAETRGNQTVFMDIEFTELPESTNGTLITLGSLGGSAFLLLGLTLLMTGRFGAPKRSGG